MNFLYSIVMLLRDFVGAYIEDPYNIKGGFNVLKTIFTDIRFWLVFCIISGVGVIPLGVILTEHEKIKDEKINAHVILQDGREFHLKKSEIFQSGDVIEFEFNGEQIITTLFTVTYK